MNKMSKLIVAMPSIMQENFNALLLVFAAILALIFANIAPLSVWYKWFITLPIGFRLGDMSVTEPIKFWVNDVLLTLFFFIIGSIVSTLLGVFLLYYNSQQLKRKVSNEY